MDADEVKQSTPFKLGISKNVLEGCWLVEISAKILCDSYPLMICSGTIDHFFTLLSRLGMIRYLNAEETKRQAEVLKCDVTSNVNFGDMNGVGDWEQLKKIINISIRNYSKWQVKNYRGVSNGIVVENSTTSPKYHRRLTFYNKTHELSLARNRAFLATLEEPQQVLQHFNNKVRIEANLYSQKQIREYFEVESTRLMDVLNSDANPLKSVMNEMFEEVSATNEEINARNADKINTLKICNWDLRRVEALIRQNTTNIRQALRPYKLEAYRQLINMNDNAIRINLPDFVNDLPY